MSKTRQNEQDIERLLNAAGQRQNPPDEVRARVYASALETWQALPQGQSSASTHRKWPGLAMAASALVAVLVGMAWYTQRIEPVLNVGDVVFAQGNYQVNGVVAQSASQKLRPGSNMQTEANSLVTVRLGSGARVTMDQGTELSIPGPHALFLSRGRIYVDADVDADTDEKDQQLVVHTPYSKIVDIGTRFEVTVGAQGKDLVVAVREGQIQVSGSGHEFSASAEAGQGDLMFLRGDTLQERRRVATTDERWDWRRAGRKPYVLAGSTVYDYLHWMARDQGYDLKFSSRAVELMSRTRTFNRSSLSSSDNTDIVVALSTTDFVLGNPSTGQWMVHFRS